MTSRIRITIEGIVQGVGFRPYLYRLANELHLKGWAGNTPQGVIMDVEGADAQLRALVDRLPLEKPPHALIQQYSQELLPPAGFNTFSIVESQSSGGKTALILPDIATCPECLAEIFDPSDRRYLYPFTNCTNCGPRFSIITDLPYDRPHTSMRGFPMCEDCLAEYHSPRNRRFHAQPNACHRCGPHVELWNEVGNPLAMHGEAILQAGRAIHDGQILAIKGIGGFHLMVDARNEQAVMRLRQRKRREEKPFALLMDSLQSVLAYCRVSEAERELLLSPEAPIVLLNRSSSSTQIAEGVVPGNPNLAVMLPCSPLQHILMRELSIPCVATSGNLSDEPICIDEREALTRLRGLADIFLIHNRPIVRHVDDSVVRVVLDKPMVLRRARGYAPYPIRVEGLDKTLLAVGGHMKNTIAINCGPNIFISQHIGDLETPQAHHAFEEVSHSLQRMYDLQPREVACDLHPDYVSTRYALQQGTPVQRVQHHHAHIVGCMAEHDLLQETVLGVSWDGTGYGTDGTIWGGEFLLSTQSDFQRLAHLHPFPLPGGEKAVKEPRRTALGLLYSHFGDQIFERTDIPTLKTFSHQELSTLRQMLNKNIQCPQTSSAGRLFDAVSSLLGIRQKVSFEGQGAMMLEFAAENRMDTNGYPIDFLFCPHDYTQPIRVETKPMIEAILVDIAENRPLRDIAARFHRTLAQMIARVAEVLEEKTVVLSGGCFQNALLLSMSVEELHKIGVKVYWPQKIPCNDGGISLGQMIVAAWR